MKSQRSLFLFVFLSLFLFLIGSCVNDLDTELSGPVPASGKMDVTQAKSFFDKMGGVVSFPLIDVTPGEIENKSLSNTISPLWDKSQQVSSKRYDAVQILLSDGNSYAARTYFVDHDGKIAFEKSQWFSYLVVARDKQDEGVAAFVATIIPSKEYSMDLTKQLRKVSFDPVGSDFSGMVLYSTTKGKFLSGRSFEEGRLVGHIKRGRSASGEQTECDCGAECNNQRKVSVLVVSSSELCVTDTIKHRIILCLYQPQNLVLLRALCPETGLYYSGEMCPACNVQHEEYYVVEVISCPGCRAVTSAGEPCLCCIMCEHGPGGHETWCMFYEPEGDGEDEGDPEGEGGGQSGGGGGGGLPPGGGNNLPIMPSKVVPFSASQYASTGGYLGKDCDCMCVAKKVMRIILGATANIGSSDTKYQLYMENSSGELYLVGNAIDVYNSLNFHLDANRPVIVGVNHSPQKGINEGATDHWVVVNGRGYDSSVGQYYYTYIETGTSVGAKATSDGNRLYYDSTNGSFIDDNAGAGRNPLVYTLTQIRPNY